MSDITGSQRERTDKVRLKKEKLAGFFYDLAKLVFAGTIIANLPSLLNFDTVTYVNLIIFFVGSFSTAFFAWLANRILTY